VGLLPPAYVGLKSALSLHLVWGPSVPRASGPPEEISIVVGATGTVKGSESRQPLCATVPGAPGMAAKAASVSSPRFPQMWKTLWKTHRRASLPRKEPVFR
jgi:hypothetical protein